MINPNDKVVCICAVMDDASAALFSERLEQGRVYAIRGVDPEVFPDGLQNVYLVGIQGHVFADGEEVGFCSSRFRKIGEAKTREIVACVQENTGGQP